MTRAWVNIECVQEEDEVAIHAVKLRVPGMHHEEAHHSHRHLDHLVRMGVVHKGAALRERVLIDEGLAWRDVRLRQSADAVHARGQDHSVPVDRGVLGKAVGDEDAHLVPLDGLDRRAGRLAVVAPEMRDHSIRDLPDHRLRD
jgi:hypothetical protein